MSTADIIRAWKDEAYRLSLAPHQRASMPENPAGQIAFSDDDLSTSVKTNQFTSTCCWVSSDYWPCW